MPLVFVHGVSNRESPQYRDNVLARDAFFRALVLPRLDLKSEAVKIFNPYWGDSGVKFRWGNLSLPDSTADLETFGTALDPNDLRIGAEVVAEFGLGASDVLEVAKRSVSDAVELVWSAAFPAVNTPDGAAALAESYRAAAAYAAANLNPPWLAIANKENFVDLLLHSVETQENVAPAGTASTAVQWESFGSGSLLDDLKEGLSRANSVGSSVLSSVVAALQRKRVHLAASMFIGDIFEYLNARGDRANIGAIPKRVLADIHIAREMVSADDPKLVIVGHSLGGVICYDLLTSFDPSVEVDMFVTVGSQVALFEEMGLYHASDPATLPLNPSTDRLPRPANIKHWINVLDANDMFSFRADGVFSGVIDYIYETGFGLMQAHSGYFQRPSFYRRLGERLAGR